MKCFIRNSHFEQFFQNVSKPIITLAWDCFFFYWDSHTPYRLYWTLAQYCLIENQLNNLPHNWFTKLIHMDMSLSPPSIKLNTKLLTQCMNIRTLNERIMKWGNIMFTCEEHSVYHSWIRLRYTICLFCIKHKMLSS